MENNERLRRIIRELIQAELDEITTTSAAGPYLTPNAFRGDKKGAGKRIKHISTQLGYKLTPNGQKDIDTPADKLKESTEINENRYYEYKNDTSATPHKKIAKAISELNRNLEEVERVIKLNSRLKSESGISSEQLWKRTQAGLVKLESRLISIATRLREIRGQ
jgi:hypothetical protein